MRGSSYRGFELSGVNCIRVPEGAGDREQGGREKGGRENRGTWRRGQGDQR